jgi:hypothetical protein
VIRPVRLKTIISNKSRLPDHTAITLVSQAIEQCGKPKTKYDMYNINFAGKPFNISTTINTGSITYHVWERPEGGIH